jgi:hypothetical protein
MIRSRRIDDEGFDHEVEAASIGEMVPSMMSPVRAWAVSLSRRPVP